MRRVWRALCAVVVGVALLSPTTSSAATYRARVRWQPASDPTAIGYRVYVRPLSGTYGSPQDAGMPAPAPDGTLSFVETGLVVTTDYAFVVTSYNAAGVESGLSNEVRSGYAQVAPLVDSDGDGLTDAQEDVNLNRIVDPGETDPNNPDTDGDGVRDGQDLCQGTARGAAVNASGCSCAQLSCDDGNPCTADSCGPTVVCTHTPIAGCATCTSASQCDDGNPCTSDSCTAGHCQHAAAADGTSCSDGNACNGAETCRAGTCVAGTPLGCNDGNPCTTDTCDPARGCVFTNNSNPCADDGNTCTSDVCAGGVCTHPPIPGCAACTSASQCDDGNPCTRDSCTAGRCQHAAAADGTSCGDGNACNGAETCRAGRCVAGTSLVCNDGNPCTTDTCDPARGCVFTNNSNPCADDGNSCTNDVCAGGTCTHPAKTNGTSCEDGLFCTVGDTCVGGVCRGGGPNCTAGATACLSMVCDEVHRGCTPTPRPNGTPCGDGNVCNGQETCENGLCVAGTPLVCDDGNPCTVDTCGPTTGCAHTPAADGAPCDDGIFCDGTESCRGGTCTSNGKPACDDGLSCTLDICDESRKLCTHQDNGCACTTDADCATTDACTTNARCEVGRCASDPVVCPNTNQCTEATCDPVTGCKTSPLPDFTPCNDNDPCTTGEMCLSGTCRVPRADVVGGADVTLSVKKFSLKPHGRALRMVALGSFQSSIPVEPDRTGLTVRIDDGNGTVLYEATVPGSMFAANYVRTRFLYVASGGQPPINGLRRLELSSGHDTVTVKATGDVPRSIATGSPAATARSGDAPGLASKQLTWSIRLGDRCVSNPVSCSGNGRKCRPA